MRIAPDRKVVDGSLERIPASEAHCNCSLADGSWVDYSLADNSVDYSVDNWLSSSVYRILEFGLSNRKLIESLKAALDLLSVFDSQTDCYCNRLLSVEIRTVFAD